MGIRILKQNKIMLVMILSIFFASCGHNYLYRSQHSPTISPDGKMLIFQSDYDNPGHYQCVIKFKTPLGWTPPIPLLFANTKMNTAGPFITYDQNNLLLTSDQKGGKGDVDLWISKRGKLWGRPENMGAPINSPGYDGFGSISPDGKTLYFTRESRDKKGTDKFCLFMSTRSGGAWTEPVRMPQPVNSEYSDFAPTILADGKTIIFSSNRTGGFGGYDLYKTEMMSGGKWSVPVNLGDTINTKYDERIVSVPASGDTLYYSQPVDQGGKVIYRIKTATIPKELRQSTVVTVAGTVKDRQNAAVVLKAEIKIVDVQEKDTQVVLNNEEDGKYFIVLNRERVYDISVSRKGYIPYSNRIDLRDVKKFDAVIRDIELEPVVQGQTIKLNNIHFRTDSDNVLDYEKSRNELERIVKLLKMNPAMKIEVSGHTDSTGTEEHNKVLSEKRAIAVYGYLVNQGIQKERLSAKGYGAFKPVVLGDDREKLERNRRVEIKVLSI